MTFQLGINGTVQGVGIWRRLIGTREVKGVFLSVRVMNSTRDKWQQVVDLLDVQRIEPLTLGVVRVEGRLSARVKGE